MKLSVHFVSKDESIKHKSLNGLMFKLRNNHSVKEINEKIQSKIIHYYDLDEDDDKLIKSIKVCDCNLVYIQYIHMYYFFLFVFAILRVRNI